jgi:RND family efflux transporter MFP subunit
MKNQIIISILCISLFTVGCGNSNKSENQETATEEHGHEEETPIIATLTQEQIKAVNIQLGKIENKELTATIKANGMLRVPNNNKGNATSLYGGVIKTLNVQIGDHVKKGQVIATIENPQFILLQEEYLTIGSKIIFAEQEVQRQKQLNEGNAGALKNLQNAQAELNTLLTRKASLQQQIQLMGINPNLVSNSNLKSALVVSSPLNGTISNLFAKIGSYVDVSSPVAEIVDNSSLHLDLQVFEKDLPLLKVGQTIHFTLTNNPTNEYDAEIFSIGSSFENDSKTISVHAIVTGNKTSLIDGMNITGIVSLNNVTSPAVPNEAIVNAEGKDYIFVVTDKKPSAHHEEEPKDNVNFEKIEVVKGVSDMGYTAVTFVQDIPGNAKIVTKGAFFINAKLTNTGEHEH